MTPFAVILKDDVAVDPRKYGAELAPALGVPVLEARLAIRRGGGVIAENLPEDEARRLAETLEADGIGCWVAPSAALPALRTPRRVTRVETSDEGLACTLQGQPGPRVLPWDRIGVVSIGLVLVPELPEEIAGVRKKDTAVIVRREQEQRDLIRDRMLAALARVDLSHEENAPAAAAHHYFFDQLRRREAMQLKAFADIVSDDAAEWWRLPLDEPGYVEGSGPDAPNYEAVPALYASLKDVHTDRSRKILQGGNVERLAFKTMEDFNRYTRWWVWRERLRAVPDLALAAAAPASGGNGQAPRLPQESAAPQLSEEFRLPPFRWKAPILMTVLAGLVALAAGVRFETRGAQCLICRKIRQDDIFRVWGHPLRESVGAWKAGGPARPYDAIIGKDHEHLYDGFGYERSGLFGFASSFGRSPGGNASPEEIDASECANGLLTWVLSKEITADEAKEPYHRLYERVRNLKDPAARRRWIELALAPPDREAPGNLLEEIAK